MTETEEIFITADVREQGSGILPQADLHTLQEVEGIGPRRAQALVSLFSAHYLPHEDTHGPSAPTGAPPG